MKVQLSKLPYFSDNGDVMMVNRLSIAEGVGSVREDVMDCGTFKGFSLPAMDTPN